MFEASRDASLPPERKTSRTARPSLTPIAYRPADAAHVLGVSRSTIYQMMAEREAGGAAPRRRHANRSRRAVARLLKLRR